MDFAKPKPRRYLPPSDFRQSITGSRSSRTYGAQKLPFREVSRARSRRAHAFAIDNVSSTSVTLARPAYVRVNPFMSVASRIHGLSPILLHAADRAVRTVAAFTPPGDRSIAKLPAFSPSGDAARRGGV